VDTERFRPDPDARSRLLEVARAPADALLVGVVAQLIERKGHAALFACLPELARREPRVRVLCFGQGPLAARLEAAAQASGEGARVAWLGLRDDLPALLPGLDLLVHPAEREGLGVAVLEAMSAGVAVVACAAGGVVDAIEDGVAGVLVPPGDRDALGRALARTLADRELRARLGRAARSTAERRFSAAALAARHVELYERMLERRSIGRLTH